jgi:hypothetical protein
MFAPTAMTDERDQPVVRRRAVSSPGGERPAPPAWRARAAAVALVAAAVALAVPLARERPQPPGSAFAAPGAIPLETISRRVALHPAPASRDRGFATLYPVSDGTWLHLDGLALRPAATCRAVLADTLDLRHARGLRDTGAHGDLEPVTLDGETYDLLPVPPGYRRYRYLALTSGRAVTLFVRVDELA